MNKFQLIKEKGIRQEKLFDMKSDENIWEGMPEFIQEKQEPFNSIIIRFRNKEDMESFSKIVGQKLTNKTKSIWYPELVRGLHSKKRYVNES